MTQAAGPLSLEELAQRLDVAPGTEVLLDAAVADLERQGRILRNREGLLLASARANLLSGRVQGHRDGFGFLIRDDGGPDALLPEPEMSKVLHGDRVLVRLVGADRRGRPEGEIVEVIERRTNRLVGRFLAERGVTIVVPEDQRIQHDILVPAAATLDATHGQVVVVEIVQQPQRHVQPVGRVVEVLGAIDDPGMEIEIAVRKFAVPHEFGEPVEREEGRLPRAVRAADLKGRVDLRDVPLVTIDGNDARDFDDAVYCEPLGGRVRGWRLVVAIADVSHYVRPGSAIDAEAQNRSTSVYFPRRVIPMLPESLSNGLCSLNPDVDRLVMVCDMVITPRGGVKAYQFYPAVMHSHARLTYDAVWDALSMPDGRRATELAAQMPNLGHLYALYDALAAARRERGALELETTETEIVCDANGRIERIVPRRRNDAHRIIEECMLAANVCTADFLQRHRHPALFRVHEGPPPQKLAHLRALLKSLGLHLGGGEAPQPADVAELISKIRSRPDAQLLQNVLLRSMQQAVYSPHNSGHFGLAYPAYTHFTSPIRRYPDLLVHRAVKAILDGGSYAPDIQGAAGAVDNAAPKAVVARWETLGAVCSANERRADEASRDVEAWLKSYYVRERVGETFTGTVSAVVPFGLFVVLDDLFVEGLVHVSELGSEYFHYNETMHELRGERTGIRYRLADRLTVQVARVDLEARRIEFRLVREIRRGATAPADAGAAPRDGRDGPSAAHSTERVSRKARRDARNASRRRVAEAPVANAKVAVGGRGRKRGH
ncbi:MAG TPA: ribonuclease R [Burkholderiaceae bacterium]|nr:ribonuclease R [Burkholderiaceae bacterium]